MTLWRIRATVDDRPGFLAVLAASLALRSVNILSVQVHATEAGAVDDFLVDAPDGLSEDDLRAAVVKGRGRDPWVRRADAHGLVDPPTRLIELATRLVCEGEELASALTTLLGEVLVTWRPEPAPERDGFTDHAMLLPDPAGGTLQVRRLEPSFTPGEYARAHALINLAAAVARQPLTRAQVLLPDGTEVTVRPADAQDTDAVRQLHERCSARSRYRRYLAGSGIPSEAAVRRLLTPANGYALVAEISRPADPAQVLAHEISRPADPAQVLAHEISRPADPAQVPAHEPEDEIVALANLVWDGPDAELGILVADAWQRRGLGTALSRRALALAARAGREAVHVHTHADNSPMIRTMHRLKLPLLVETDGAIVTLSVALRAGTGSPSRAR
jgi:GNAT superfamily N-acetyltransferase